LATQQTILFTRGVPATESFPTETLAEASAAAIAEHGKVVLQYGAASGFQPLRSWLAQWHDITPEQVMVSNGSLQLIGLLCLQLLQPGDTVFTEAPSYDRTITLLRRSHANVVGIPLQADGPDLDALEAALREHSPKFFYTIPDFQNPSGVVCSAAKRRRIVELAERHNFLILEDAPYRPLRYRGQDEPSYFELAPERTLHLSSVSKLISPGMRVGYLLSQPALITQLSKAAEDTYVSPNYLAQGIAYEWLRRDHLLAHLERLKALYSPRLDACLAALDRYLPEAEATRPDGGFFLSLTLPDGISTTAVREVAAQRQLVLADGLAFFPDGNGECFLRLPYCALSPAEIEDGVQRLAASVHEVARTR
jgi:DNA-binding transcriptional MocR family regulator